MNECIGGEKFDPQSVNQTVNRWIADEINKTGTAVTDAITSHKYNEAAGAIYHFVWHVFCDWYLELIKPLLNGSDEQAKRETRAMCSWVLDRSLILLHPFMPFMTEELWQHFGELGLGRDTMLILASWPDYNAGLEDADASAEMDWVIRLVSEVRSVRAEMNVPAGAKIPLLIRDASEPTLERLERHMDLIERLARLSSVKSITDIPSGSVQTLLDEATLVLPLADVIDLDKEKARLEKEIAKMTGAIGKIDAKLTDGRFMAKAPKNVIEEQRTRKADTQAARSKLTDALERLKGAA